MATDGEPEIVSYQDAYHYKVPITKENGVQYYRFLNVDTLSTIAKQARSCDVRPSDMISLCMKEGVEYVFGHPTVPFVGCMEESEAITKREESYGPFHINLFAHGENIDEKGARDIQKSSEYVCSMLKMNGYNKHDELSRRLALEAHNSRGQTKYGWDAYYLSESMNWINKKY